VKTERIRSISSETIFVSIFFLDSESKCIVRIRTESEPIGYE
jgi:hypothetical protein